MPLTEVFGSEGTGAWLAREVARPDTPWHLVVPDDTAADGSARPDFYAMRSPNAPADGTDRPSGLGA